MTEVLSTISRKGGSSMGATVLTPFSWSYTSTYMGMKTAPYPMIRTVSGGMVYMLCVLRWSYYGSGGGGVDGGGGLVLGFLWPSGL